MLHFESGRARHFRMKNEMKFISEMLLVAAGEIIVIVLLLYRARLQYVV